MWASAKTRGFHTQLDEGPESAFPLGWPWEAQSSPRVARESWGWRSSHCRAGVGSLSLLQWVFVTQELNQGLLRCRWILYHLSYQVVITGLCTAPRRYG